MAAYIDVCFTGDSFVQGIGDPGCQGWVGRIVERTRDPYLTAYNLGARGWTSGDVVAHWRGECAARLRDGNDCRIVASFGANDATLVGGSPRVEHHDSVGNLSSLLQESAAAGWEVLIVGPPPVSDAAQNQRIRDLNQGYGQSCNEAGVSYVDVFAGLLASTAWMREVRTGDGAHPADAGYGLLAALVWPHWITWIGAE